MGEMSGMWEGVLFSLLFVVLLTAVLAHFNTQYDQDFDVGLNTSGITAFTDTVGAAGSEAEGGEVTQTSEGLTLTASWNIAWGILSTLWDFITGDWIGSILVSLNMDESVALTIEIILRALLLGTLIFALIKLFFKTSV